MSQVETRVDSRAIAVYPDHATAEEAVRRLLREGFAMEDVSIVGRDFQVTEEPIGFVSTKDFASVGAGTGAWVGGLFGRQGGDTRPRTRASRTCRGRSACRG